MTCRSYKVSVAGVSTYRLGVALTLFMLVTGGCGPSGPQRVPVSGKVTYGGGNWPSEGQIGFAPIENASGSSSGIGIAKFDRTGNYEVTTPSGNSVGLYPGSYQLRIECWDPPPQMGGPPAKDCLPPRFAAQNRDLLTIEVKPGEPVVYNFDVPRR